MITFQNKGLIDIRAITTFGVSSKDGGNPIGYFGTGLKYAISIILRHGGKVTVWRGLEPFEFTVKREKVRNDEFDIIHMNDQPLGFTTHVGSTWEPWHAFREIYCNMLDEQGSCSDVAQQPKEGHTTVAVVGFPAFEECYYKRSAIVLSDQPKWNFDNKLDVREGASTVMYYRGIMAAELDKPAIFTYSIVQPLVLTEDRTIKSTYTALSILCDAIIKSTDEEFVRRFLQADIASFEHHFDLQRTGEEPSGVFMRVAYECIKEPQKPLNVSVVALLAKWADYHRKFEPVPLTKRESNRLDRAKALMRKLNFDIDKYKVYVVKSLGPTTLGTVMDGHIVLSYRVFMMGENTIFGTLLEEFLHLDHMFSDMTRDFQNFLMDLIATLAAELHGDRLEEAA